MKLTKLYCMLEICSIIFFFFWLSNSKMYAVEALHTTLYKAVTSQKKIKQALNSDKTKKTNRLDATSTSSSVTLFKTRVKMAEHLTDLVNSSLGKVFFTNFKRILKEYYLFIHSLFKQAMIYFCRNCRLFEAAQFSY